MFDRMKIDSLSLRRREALAMLGFAAFRGAAFAQKGPAFPKNAIIRTILKDMKPEELAGGATLFHEHMSLAEDFLPRWGQYQRAARAAEAAAKGGTPPANPPANRPANPPQSTATSPQPPQKFFMDDLDLMVDEMKAAKADGVACLVDGGHEDMGRKLENLKIMSERSGLPIVAGGGFYAQPFYPAEIATWSEDQIVDELLKHAHTQPIGAFGEIGTWTLMTADEKKVFRAIGRAHVKTNLPIFTHSDFGRGVAEQLDAFESVGVKPEHVCIGHVGGLREADPVTVKAICKRGAFVGYDRQGGPGDAPNVPQVKALIDAGYAANLLFASDLSSANQLKKNGGGGYAKTVTVFVPKLKAAGVDEAVLHSILVDNPRRFLAFVPKISRKSIGV
jgi:phosphotriesterase-related protein